jgi:hypothetical protein
MAVFKNPKDPENYKLVATLEALVKLCSAPLLVDWVDVVEIDCADPGCVDKTTKITVAYQDKSTRNFHIHKPIVFVRKSDVEKLFKNYGN